MRKCRSSNPLLFESLIYKHYLAIKVRIYLIVLCFNGFIGIMKKHERVTLHREKLYQEVWQTPISQLASKYGLSDVGLAKVCKRMDTRRVRFSTNPDTFLRRRHVWGCGFFGNRDNA